MSSLWRFMKRRVFGVVCLFILCLVLFSLDTPFSKPTLKNEIQFWNPNTWTLDNFMNWDWRINVQNVIDTPIDGLRFWMRWIQSPRFMSREELWNYTFIYFQLMLDNFFLYEKGVAMQIQGLWLQHKYDQAFKRLIEHLIFL